jgi:accessory colonization factor AcfC
VYELREAIIAMLAESIGAVDELSPEENDVMIAWNKMCEASPTVGIPEPITDEDIDAAFED